MVVRVRRLVTLAAALAAAAALPAAGTAATQQTVLPTLYVEYTINCTFTIHDDEGRRLTSISPGTYQIHVTTPVVFATVDLTGIFDMTACKGAVEFRLNGPGVSVGTTLQDGDEDKDYFKETFQAGSTYVAQDLNQPSVARVAFTTTASGAPNAPATPFSPSASSDPKGSTSKDPVGSAVKATTTSNRGTLTATVTPTGKLTLTLGGKAVEQLRTGRYTVKVLDRSKQAGFVLQQVRNSAVTLTKPGFVGSHSGTLTMKPGQWVYFSGGGPKHFFLVVAGT